MQLHQVVGAESVVSHEFRLHFPHTECHTSCKTCTGATNQDCDECKDGWEEDDQETCVGKRTSNKYKTNYA